MNDNIYITINHLDDFNAFFNGKVGDILILRKDLNNPYDDEAIAVYDKNDCKIGYVANSVHSVARGTYSAGRAYQIVKENNPCRILFIINDCIIASVIDDEGMKSTDMIK